MTSNFRFVWLGLLAACLSAQTLPPRYVGTVQAVRAEAGEVDVKSDQGVVQTTKTIPESLYQRVAPGEKDLKNAQPIKISDVAPGDRVLVAVEPGTSDLRRLVVMPATDIAKRNEADRLDWQKRGISGVVTAKIGNEITLKLRSMAGETQAVVSVSDQTKYRRYAPDSVKFADALTSNLADITLGDQVRARGTKSEDGTKVGAEEVVFGTFVTKAGKISAVDTEKKEITVLEIGTNQPLVVKISADSQLKKMPDFAAMMGGGGAPGGMPQGGTPPGGMRPSGMPAGGPPAGMRPPDMSQMLERMPPAKLDDLKPGQSIVVSSTKGAAAGKITAITLLANADMLIQMATMQSGGAAGRRPQGAVGGGMPGGGMPAGMMGGMDGMQLPGIVP